MQSRRAPSKPVQHSAEPAAMAIKVMIVDDSLTVRTVFSRMISSDPDLTISATASTAEGALAKLETCDADVILLDLEMPGMGGLDALPKLLKAKAAARVLVVSSLAEQGAEHTVAALSMGAADTMLKPRSGGFDDSYQKLLLDKIKALGGASSHRAETGADVQIQKPGRAISAAPNAFKRPEIIAFGASTGGIHALNIVLNNLPLDLNLPIAITQHLPSNFMPIFARQIEAASGRRTLIANEGTKVARGEILIATGEGHMEFCRIGSDIVTKVSSQPVTSNCLPSVDPMLSSLARTFEGRALAVILSGMGKDGLEGAKELSQAGGRIIAQDPESCAVWGMPGAVTNAGLADCCLAPKDIARAITNAAGAAAWS